jgi:GxxExxY protein
MKTYDDKNYPHSELSGKIIAVAKAVHDHFRPGLDEVLYERAMCIEFADRDIFFEVQKKFDVHYKKKFIGQLIPDLIVEGAVIVDLKVVDDFSDTHIAQMLGYLSITGLEIGILINFKHATLQIKRVANIKKNQ